MVVLPWAIEVILILPLSIAPVATEELSEETWFPTKPKVATSFDIELSVCDVNVAA